MKINHFNFQETASIQLILNALNTFYFSAIFYNFSGASEMIYGSGQTLICTCGEERAAFDLGEMLMKWRTGGLSLARIERSLNIVRSTPRPIYYVLFLVFILNTYGDLL